MGRMAALIALFVVLGTADALLTLHWIDQGVATEWNPIMAWVLEHGGAAWFLAVRVTVPAVLSTYLHRRGHRLLLRFLCGVHAMVLLWHVIGYALLV